jgi:hypothetical protein
MNWYDAAEQAYKNGYEAGFDAGKRGAGICDNCACRPVCNIFSATGGVNKCVHKIAKTLCGKWIWKDGKCFCSVCYEQSEPKFVYQDGTVDEYLYCPNCGAQMKMSVEE